MPVLVRKAHYLILDTRAVSRSDSMDFPAVQRCPVKVVQNDPVRFLRCPGQVAAVGVLKLSVRQKGEGSHRLVTMLFFHFVEVNRPHVDSRRCTCLIPSQFEAQFLQTPGQFRSVHQPLRSAVMSVLADNDASLQRYAGGGNHCLAGNPCPCNRCHRRHPVVLRFDGRNFSLSYRQICCSHQGSAHPVLVCLFVCLSPKRMYRRSLAHVQHPALQKCIVNRQSHFSAQRIQFPYQMSLCASADHGIAGHQGNTVHIQCQKKCIDSHPRCRQRCFAPGMPCADNYYVSHTKIVLALSFCLLIVFCVC